MRQQQQKARADVMAGGGFAGMANHPALKHGGWGRLAGLQRTDGQAYVVGQ